jgi:hypothetical protein
MLNSTSVQNLNSKFMYSRLHSNVKYDKMLSIKNMHRFITSRSKTVSSLVSLNIPNLGMIFCTLVDLSIIYIFNFCFDFFEIFKNGSM